MKAVLVGLMLAIIASSNVTAQEELSNADAYKALALKSAGEYKMRSEAVELQFHPKSILSWSNPAVGELYGGVFVWTQDHQPKVIGSLYKWYDPFTHSSHELQSLSTGPISAEKNNRVVWKVSEPGIQWNAVPDAPPVAKTQPSRVVQMRAIAKRFKVVMTEKDQTKVILRVLSQPLYRYSSKSADVTDGAVIGLVKGTDPEAVLLLEAVAKGNDTIWQYALARLNFLKLQATFQGETVWELEQLESPSIYGNRDAYTKFQID